MSEILLIVFAVLLLFYLYFLWRIYSGLNKLSYSRDSLPEEFVSVIIPFRNEEDNISESVKSIQTQDYPADKYEVIYVNDASSDNSLSILCRNISRSNISVITLSSPDSNGKKEAIAHGIRSAKGDIIVTTDCDCTHNSNWLNSMMNCFTPVTGLLAGGVRFHPADTLFQRVQALEFAALIIAGAGLIGSGSPFICNGANLAYRKKLFFLLNGFDDNLHLASGDDEFLMHKINRSSEYKVSFCTEKDAVVTTKPNSTLSEFINQRKRWGSKGLYYNKIIMLQLVLIFLFYSGLLIQFMAGFLNPLFFVTFLGSLGIKAVFEYFIMKKGAELMFNPSILRNFLLTELLHLPYIIIMPLLGTFSGFRWKNRDIRR
jgi:poly-beta-1,6-N-acetyl-D-glucosamine synthase